MMANERMAMERAQRHRNRRGTHTHAQSQTDTHSHKTENPKSRLINSMPYGSYLHLLILLHAVGLPHEICQACPYPCGRCYTSGAPTTTRLGRHYTSDQTQRGQSLAGATRPKAPEESFWATNGGRMSRPDDSICSFMAHVVKGTQRSHRAGSCSAS